MPQDPPPPLPDQPQPPADRPGDDLAPTDEPAAGARSGTSMYNQRRYQADPQVAGHAPTARDRVLDRHVEVRNAALAEVDDLEREARFLARLDHAGTPAVYDFIRGDTGGMLVLRRVEGITLAEGVTRAAAGMPPPELVSPVAVVQMMTKVCEALASAHSRGVVHRRIVPECILLGWHGQVVVQDWGTAMEENARPLTVRYVSSVQPSVTASMDGLHQDLRGVGGCLFAALVRRAPKPEGSDPIGIISAEERRRFPHALENIVRRAMQTDASNGYPDMPSLAQDLSRFLEGQAPSFMAPCAAEQARTWVRSHRKALGWAAVVCLGAGIAVGAAFGPQLLERWRWGRPVAVEDFSDSTWKNRWQEPLTLKGMFRVENGRLVSIAERGAYLNYRQRLTTPVAIEYTGEILPGSEPCDLSLNWYEDEEEDGVKQLGGRTCQIQCGGNSNVCYAISVSGNRLPVAYAGQRLEVGRKYRFRVEIEEGCISLFADGRSILSYTDLVPFTSGRFGLYAHYPGKAFDDVAIYQKPAPEGISPLSIGDHYLKAKNFDVALSHYEQVAAAYGQRPIGQQARFRKGLAEWNLGRKVEALSTWESVSEPELRARIDSYAIQGSQDNWLHEGFITGFQEKYRHNPDMREGLRHVWHLIMERLAGDPAPDPRLVDRFLKLREDFFPDDGMAIFVASNVLMGHARYADCMQRFPGNQWVAASCLLALGRTREALANDWITGDARIKAWQMNGDFAKMVEAKGIIPVLRALALCKLGRGEEVVNDPELRHPVLLHLGRAAELLDQHPQRGGIANDALIALGRWAEAAGAGIPEIPGTGGDANAQLLLGDVVGAERGGKVPRHAFRFMMAVEAGDQRAMDRLRPLVTMPSDLRYHQGWFTAAIVLPLVDRWRGDVKALERHLRPQLDFFSGIYGKRPWFVARALLGDIQPEAVQGMPAVTEGHAWSLLCQGINAELAGKPADAAAAYAAFIQLPVHQRLLALNIPDPEVEWFVRWRQRVLAAK